LKALPTATALLLVGLCACATTPPPPAPLPLHVALIPVRVSAVEPPPLIDAEPAVLAPQLDAVRVSEALVAALRATCFARVSLLDAPPAPAERWSDESRDAWWVQRAQDRGADLVLACELRHADRVHHRRNARFWGNLSLFRLGGPACYFVNDRSYEVNAELEAELHDVARLTVRTEELGGDAARVLRATCAYREADLDFLDRAGGRAPPFLASLIVPAGLLASESEATVEHLEERMVAELAGRLATTLREALRPAAR